MGAVGEQETKGGHRVPFVFKVCRRAGPGKMRAYLPDARGNLDQLGGPLRMRPFHCTSTGLTPAITPNVGNSSV